MISLIIPAYNEELIVSKTIKEALDTLKKMNLKNFEIILVDDGCIDNTNDKAKKYGIKIIRNPINMGYGFSLKRGITNARFETVVIMDADDTYPVNEIPKLYNEYLKGFDMVIGQRTGKFYEESKLKSFLRKLLKFIVEFAAEKKIPDINSGLRVFKRDTIKKFFPQNYKRILKLQVVGKPIKVVSILQQVWVVL